MNETFSLFYTPLHKNFMHALVDGYIHRFPHGKIPHQGPTKHILLILPNHRLCQAASMLLEEKGGIAPLIIAMSDMETWMKDRGYDVSSSEILLSSLQQMMRLLPLVMQWKKDLEYENAVAMTYDLVALLEDMEREECNTEYLLQNMPDNVPEHCKEMLEFLKVLFYYWPDVLKEQNATTPMRQRNMLFKKLSRSKKKFEEAFFIILAGSTGSQPATRHFMKRLQEEAGHMIILPHVDMDMEETLWQTLESDHPSYCTKYVMDDLGVTREACVAWDKAQFVPEIQYRTNMVHYAMREMLHAPSEPLLFSNAGDVSYYICDNHDHEALTIACALRDIMHKKSAEDIYPIGLITNDRLLIRKVKNHLARWDIISDDSAGKLLEFHPCWIYFMQILEIIQKKNFTYGLLAYLMHPLTALKMPEEKLHKAIEIFENKVLRQKIKISGWKDIDHAVSLAVFSEEEDTCKNMIAEVKRIFAPLEKLLGKKRGNIKELIWAHIGVIEESATSLTFSGKEKIAENAREIVDFLEELKILASHFSAIESEHYGGILKTLVKYRNYSVDPPSFYPGVIMLSPMDARFLPFGYVILSGLNENSWPSLSETGYWMNHAHRVLCGFPPLEKAIGQSAHDFCSFFSIPHVILTRGVESGFDAKDESRFLSQLQALLKKYGNKDFFRTSPPYDLWAYALDTVNFLEEAPVNAVPPVVCRPTRYHVSEVEKLIRDPYSVYAAQILQLEALPTLDKQEASKGMWLHEVCNYFINHANDRDDASLEAYFMECGEKFFPYALSFQDEIFWKATLKTLSQWMAEDFIEKRQNKVNIYAGLQGSISLHGKKGKVTLHGKIDRCEVTQEGRLKIIDYKTTSLPSKKEIMGGYSPQLGLLALIAKEGGIENIHYTLFEEAEYWKLATKIPEITALSAMIKPCSLDVFLEKLKEACGALLHNFSYEEIAYIAAPDSQRVSPYSPYRHLGRME